MNDNLQIWKNTTTIQIILFWIDGFYFILFFFVFFFWYIKKHLLYSYGSFGVPQ
jgi:hypothetical protein